MKRITRLLAPCIVLLAFGLAQTGCYKTKYELTPPQGMARMGAEHFHLSLIGIIELSSPIDLVAECAGSGALMVDEQVSVLGGLVNIILGTFIPILHVHNATVGCGMGGGAPPPGPMPVEPAPAPGG